MSQHTPKHPKQNEDSLMRLQGIWMKYQKPLLIALVAIVVLVGGWYFYETQVVQPKEEQATNAIFKAEENFAMDSINAALNGNGTDKGFLYIINNYGSTKPGKLAKYYAGICYLKQSNFNKAVEYLSGYQTDAPQIQMMAYGSLADAYSELGKNDEAISYYQKAASTFPSDELNSSEYLFRAGLKLETLGKSKEALDIYKEIKEKFPKTNRAYEVDKYIYRLSIEPNDFSTK
ncbi:MAG: tetratricopeptide repeat protein [Bacteroidetes bacterium]|nr:tetratricopeptide repeat protein [Bacteroidota bacterium]